MEKKQKKEFGFLDSVKFVIESAKYPSWNDVKSLTADVLKISVILGTINLIAHVIYGLV